MVVGRVAGHHAVDIDVDRRAVERESSWLRRERPAEVESRVPDTVAPWPGVSMVPNGSTLEALSTRRRASRSSASRRRRSARSAYNVNVPLPPFGSMLLRIMNPQPARDTPG